MPDCLHMCSMRDCNHNLRDDITHELIASLVVASEAVPCLAINIWVLSYLHDGPSAC